MNKPCQHGVDMDLNAVGGCIFSSDIGVDRTNTIINQLTFESCRSKKQLDNQLRRLELQPRHWFLAIHHHHSVRAFVTGTLCAATAWRTLGAPHSRALKEKGGVVGDGTCVLVAMGPF